MNQNLNGKVGNAINYLSQQMPNASESRNPVENLTVDEITYIQIYLDKIKTDKIGQLNIQKRNSTNRATDLYDPLERSVPMDWRNYLVPNDNSNAVDNTGRLNWKAGLSKSYQTNHQTNTIQNTPEPGSRGSVATRYGKKMMNNDDYYNPYEYGARQNQLNVPMRDTYCGPYQNDTNMLDQLGLTQNLSNEKFPGQVRNVNVESYLLQGEPTHLPGQNEITQKDYNRFELLPFDPQDPKHIVWNDMPRGGYSTRADRMSM